jgi:hypothetical protein
VSERVANRLETLPLDLLGRPSNPVVTPSSGAVPFGFGITQRGTMSCPRRARAARPPTGSASAVRSTRSAGAGGQVATFRVGFDGSLELVGTAPAAAGLTGAAAS